ncbi:hypothetical protein ACFW4O_11120 [Streptomyces mutabilis]|uniref:hypothetical protein n=1 Tax=Streptomyces TaxID=1883 RepID=UPI0036A181A7
MASFPISGATNALGLALAEEFAEARHQLLLHGRNPQRPVPVAQHFGTGQYIADLSALADPATRGRSGGTARSPRRAGQQRGCGFTWNGTIRSMPVDGYQQRPTVRHLSPVLPTRQLLPLLRAGSPSRSADIASVA